MKFDLSVVEAGQDLDSICAQMQPEAWGKDNEMTSYWPEKLRAFIEAGGILLLAKDGDPSTGSGQGKIAGAALCYILPHPAGDDSLYVHELDTHPDYRRQGVATKLMKKAGEIAKQKACVEVWVGTEQTNTAADALYRSLNPYEIEPSFIYAYKPKLSDS